MTNGIIQVENGFAVKDFETEKVIFNIGEISFPSYEDAVEGCFNKFYPASYWQYLTGVGKLLKSGDLKKEPDLDIWENLIFAEDYRGMYDGETNKYRNVTAMDRDAATEEEIDYIDALAFTYKSLRAMVKAS